MSDELLYSPGGNSTYVLQVRMNDFHFKFVRKISSISVALYNKEPLMFPSIIFPVSSLVVAVTGGYMTQIEK